MISLLWTILLFPSFLLSTLSTDPPTDAKYVDLIEKDDYYGELIPSDISVWQLYSRMWYISNTDWLEVLYPIQEVR